MIHIAFNIDHHYVTYCAVTMVSAMVNNPGERLTFHVVTNDLAASDQKRLVDLAATYGSEVRFYRPDLKWLRGFTIRKFSKRITLATYYRCILSALLPSDLDRVLYLDCDILVRKSLLPLWNMPLGDCALAAVIDIGTHEEARYRILKYPMRDGYFNAGVLLINLAYWRQHDVPQAELDFYHAHPERILYNDQDLLNLVLHDRKCWVDLTWNAQDGFYRNNPEFTPAWYATYGAQLHDPAILHFTNRKPWNYDSQHPMCKEYAHYMALVPWVGHVKLGLIGRVKRFFRLMPFRLHWRRPRYIDLERLVAH